MIQQVTQGIRISVNTFFEGTYFKNYRLHYSFGYRISISNHGKDTVQLQSRHWKIFDSNGNHREVRGKGVVGEQPTIEPGDEFEYTSGTPLKTSS